MQALHLELCRISFANESQEPPDVRAGRSPLLGNSRGPVALLNDPALLQTLRPVLGSACDSLSGLLGSCRADVVAKGVCQRHSRGAAPKGCRM